MTADFKQTMIGKSYGLGTDTVTTVMTYNNASTIKPFVEFNHAIAGNANYSGLRLYVQGASKSAGYHIESELAGADGYLTTRSALFSLNRGIGYLQNGNVGSGTRKLWIDQYDSSTGNLRLVRQSDGVIRTMRTNAFTYDAVAWWSQNNTSHSVYQISHKDNDDIATLYDCYYDGTNFKSSSTTGNVRFWKKDGALQIDGASGVAAGGAISFTTGMVFYPSTQEFEFFKHLKKAGTAAEIYVADGSTAQSIPTGVTYTKSTAFTNNGESSNCTSDATNDKITITKTGKYRVSGAFSGQSGTANVVFRGAAFLNGVEQDRVHFKRKFATASDSGSMSFTGFIDVTSVPVDLDFRVRHDNAGSINLTIEYANLNVEYWGET